ncbi:hypothetical protein E1301_Tti011353 [Triplophysa tibetana]|uniref:TNFR-Cys domain-containing protein n=1 Tax=Triplophysa tibetana TaxID=1572043 RepID=A0A5A9PA50_9TELE|nr:hypothetical protein E1301_Tti011353 [Triplophysa tibetana]
MYIGDIGSASDICTGAHCQRSSRSPDHQSALPHHQSRFSVYSPRRPAVPYTVIQPQHSRTGSPKENPRTITAEVFNPHGCTGGRCHGSARPTHNNTKECKGLECKLPVRIRQEPQQHPCIGDACSRGSDVGRGRLSFAHMQDRAEQVLEEFPEYGLRGGPSSGIQLTCDIKPGFNEVQSEEALVLHFHLAKGQEKLVEQLHGHEAEIKQFQSTLSVQRAALLTHQREILDQQRRMFEQMEEVKTQYNLLLDSVKHLSVQGPQGIIESHFEGLRSQTRTYPREAFMHKMNMDASVTDADRPLLGCGSCKAYEYCNFSADRPRCEKCSVCLPGFFLVAQCSIDADRICQDRDECLEIQNLCKEQNKCLNTPGGFRCSGMSERDAAAGMCGRSYFYNSEMEECQACSECDSHPMTSPCSAMSDAVCSNPSEGRLSLSWSGDVVVVKGSEFPNVQLLIRGNSDGNLLSCTDGLVVLHQHGLVWVDHNLALRHGCRSFIQACLRLNSSEDESRDLSGMRVEQREGKSIQSTSVSGAAAVEPGHALVLSLKSASNQCNQDNDSVHLQSNLISPFSLFWLSHDTGAVAMTAQAVASAHYHTNYRPAFRVSSISDPYMVRLTDDNRGVRFRESGTVKFVLQQSLYSMGQACVSEGFYLLAYVNQNGSSAELTRTYKPGVHFRDTSISLSAATTVDSGDMLTFELLAPAQCSVRYFGDDSGISMLSLVWIPSAASTSLSAAVSRKGLPSGAVRNKPLFFLQTTSEVPQVTLARTGVLLPHRNFIFREAGTASVALDLRLIHSCSLIKLTLLEEGETKGAQAAPIAQQIGGPMQEGSVWASVGLRVSFQVHNGTVVFATVDCVRGRVNHIAFDAGSSISILWTVA